MNSYLKVGDLLYCRNRGTTTCCYQNEACDRNYYSVHDEMTNKSVEFLQNPNGFLKSMVKDLKYDTCHKIDGYDASACATDCEKLKTSEFAKNCTENVGLFKCCIRYKSCHKN